MTSQSRGHYKLIKNSKNIKPWKISFVCARDHVCQNRGDLEVVEKIIAFRRGHITTSGADLTADKYEVLGSTPMKVRESTKTSGAGTRDKVGTRFNLGAV